MRENAIFHVLYQTVRLSLPDLSAYYVRMGESYRNGSAVAQW